MKLYATMLICLILVSPALSEMFQISTGEAIAVIVILGGEVALITGGISSVIGNVQYLNSDYQQEPSLTGDYVLATLNIGMGALILGSSSNNSNSTWTAIGLGQLALGLAGGITSAAVKNKYAKYGPTVMFDSEKKPVAGLSLNLRW